MEKETLSLADYIANPALAKDERREIIERLRSDPFWLNYELNKFEFKHGFSDLISYPISVSIPISNTCNAKCLFCTAWLHREQPFLQPNDIQIFSEVLPYAHNVGLVSYGEPLANPHLIEILSKCREYMDKRATFYLVTNGHLLKRYLQPLLEAKVSAFNISLNAITPETHCTVTGLPPGSFASIMSSIEALISYKRTHSPKLYIGVSLVLCRQNLEDAPVFVRRMAELGIDKISIRSLAPMNVGSSSLGINYHLLPPSLHPSYPELSEALLREINQSRVPVQYDAEGWDAPILPMNQDTSGSSPTLREYSREEALEDPLVREAYRTYAKESAHFEGRGKRLTSLQGNEKTYFDGQTRTEGLATKRSPHFRCGYIYHHLLIQDCNLLICPCCYLYSVPGHELLTLSKSGKFHQLWNSEAYREIRHRLREGPLFRICHLCSDQGLIPLQAPQIIKAPQDQTVSYGDPVRLSVVAAGECVNYQWYHKGTPIDGANKADYHIGRAMRRAGGEYGIAVWNSEGKSMCYTNLSVHIPFTSTLNSVCGFSTRAFIGGTEGKISLIVRLERRTTLLLHAQGISQGEAGRKAPRPSLSVFSKEGRLIARNARWMTPPEAAQDLPDLVEIESEITPSFEEGNMPLPTRSEDAAMAITIPQGEYIITLEKGSGPEGLALLEVYQGSMPVEGNYFGSFIVECDAGPETASPIVGLVVEKKTRFTLSPFLPQQAEPCMIEALHPELTVRCIGKNEDVPLLNGDPGSFHTELPQGVYCISPAQPAKETTSVRFVLSLDN
jgi:pyruvate-formate lyase-activating enzyme